MTATALITPFREDGEIDEDGGVFVEVELFESAILHLVSYGREAFKRACCFQVGNDADGSPADVGIMVEVPGTLFLQRIPQGYERLIEVKWIAVACCHRAVCVVDAIPVKELVEQNDAVCLGKSTAGEEEICRPVDWLEGKIVLMDKGCPEELVVHPVLE